MVSICMSENKRTVDAFMLAPRSAWLGWLAGLGWLGHRGRLPPGSKIEPVGRRLFGHASLRAYCIQSIIAHTQTHIHGIHSIPGMQVTGRRSLVSSGFGNRNTRTHAYPCTCVYIYICTYEGHYWYASAHFDNNLR